MDFYKFIVLFLIISIVMMVLTSYHGVSCYIRYSQNGDSYLTGESFTLTHLDNAVLSRKWTISSPGCHFDSSDTMESVSFVCNAEGLHAVKLEYTTNTGSHELVKHLSVKGRVQCYSWYLTQLNQDVYTDGDFTIADRWVGLCLWITEPQYLSEDEIANIATAPSLHSKFLTDQLKRLGLAPRLEAFTDYPIDLPVWSVFLQFLTNTSCWLFAVQGHLQKELEIVIRSEPVPLYGCTVRDTRYTLTDAFIPSPLVLNGELQTFITVSSSPKMIQHPCNKNMAAFMTSSGIYWTSDGLKHTSRINLTIHDSNGVHVENLTVSDVALTSNHMILLAENNLYAVNIFYLTVTEIQSNVSTTSLTSRRWCCADYNGRKDNNMYLAWSEDELFLHKITDPSISSILSLTLPTSGYTEFKILAVAFAPMCQIIGVAANVTSGLTEVALYLYDMNTDTWSLVATSPYSGQPCQVQLQFAWSGTIQAFLWHGCVQVIIYKYNVANSTLLTTHVDVDVGNGQMEHMLMSGDGDTVIISTTEDVFATNSHWSDIIKLSMKAEASSLLWFTASNALTMVSSIGGTVVSKNYPLRTEIINAAYPNILCSFSRLRTNNQQRHYHLDVSKNITVWAYIGYPLELYDATATFLKLELDGDITRFITNMTVSHQIHSNYVEENMTLTISVNSSIMSASVDEMGFVISPKEVSPICHGPYETVSYVSVGCQASLRLHIDGMFVENCEDYLDYIYFVQSEDQTLSLTYDLNRYGCPLYVKTDEAFVPDLNLCTDIACEPMTANYIVWEEYNQEFSYNTTMEKAGCLRYAQTWMKMMELGNSNNNSINKSEVWTPLNYEDCFTADDPSVLTTELREPYEILNRSSYNSIRWLDRRGMYIMHIRIMDKTYSFCQLETAFGVHIWGVLPEDNSVIMILSLLIFFIAIMVIFIMSYRYVRDIYYNRGYHSVVEFEEDMKVDELQATPSSGNNT